MKLYVIRHGETDWNVKRLFQGQINTSLNEKGEAQAREARERIKDLGLTFDAVYSSPIDRAARTIEIVTGMDRSQFHLDERLLEMNFGILDETPFDKEAPLAGTLFHKPSEYIPPDGAESFPELETRIDSFLSEMRKERPGENILVGCHGCTMRVMLAHIGYLELDDIWNQGIGNCTIMELTENEPFDPALMSNSVGKNCKPDGRGFHVTNIYETQDWFGQQKA